MQLILEQISYAYPGSPLSLFRDVSATLPVGWTGVVGANGTGKTTLLRIATRELRPQTGRVVSPRDTLYCAQPTSAPPHLLKEFAMDWGADAGHLRSVLRIGDDWPWRFDSLSHGERKRLQLAVALWRRPVVLAVDEPTNHLDGEGRALVLGAFREFDGIGLLVSHDRDLLDTLVRQCLFVGDSEFRLRPGTYTEAKTQIELERRSAAAERAAAKRELGRLRAEEARRRTEADRAHVLRSRARVDPGDRDAKARIGLAIVSGKDGQAGRISAQMTGRMKRAQQRLEAARVGKALGGGGIRLDGADSRRDVVARLKSAEIPLGDGRVLMVPETVVGGDDRIAITGRNGAGKSTLLRHIAGQVLLPAECVLEIPQELDVESVQALHADLMRLSPAGRGRVLSLLARLGSDPEHALAGEALSPGEARKLMVAIGVASRPQLILLDEPTNHLDIVVTEALEEALSTYTGALVIVSHDSRFVARLTTTRWQLDEGLDGRTAVVSAGMQSDQP